MLKNKWLTVISLTLLSLCMVMFAGCTLEDDIETLREKVANQQGGNPFSGTSWSGSYYGDSATLSFTSSTWTLTYTSGGYETGSYTRKGNTATLSVYEYGSSMEVAQVTISGSTLTVKMYDGGQTITLTKSGNSGGPTPQPGAPGAPTGVTASAAANSIMVSWNPVSGADSYRIYRSSSASGSYNIVGDTSSPPYMDTGLSANTTYYYKVSAINNNGQEGSQSSYTSATTSSSSSGGPTPQPGAPGAPTGVTASATGNSITVSWSSVSGAYGYYIYRSSNASGSYTSIGESSSTYYSDTGLSANTTYYYKVSAVNSSGEGPQSSYTSATTTSSSSRSTTPLTMNQWRNDSFTSSTLEAWYSFSVTSGTTYQIWWNDSYDGNNSKTVDIYVSAEYSNGTPIFEGADSGYSYPRSFTASSSGTVYVKVESYYYTGTYAIAYSTSSTRPN